MPEPTNIAERAQDIRDLRGQIAELRDDPNAGEILFREISPARKKVPIYSMVDGEEIYIPVYLLERTLAKRLPDGRFMFTARQHEAPEYKRGNVKCFLHPESIDRAVLDEVGLTGITCNAAHLRSAHSKRIHALHRHSQSWAAYQEHMENQKETERNARQDAQLEATLAIARAAGTVKE